MSVASSFEFDVFKKVWEAPFIFVDFLRCEFDLCDDLFLIFWSEVCHFNIFDLIPTLLDDVEFGRVGRQSLAVKPVGMLAFVFRLQTKVTFPVVPEDNDRAWQMFVQCVEYVRHLGGLRTAGKRRREQFPIVTDRRDRHESDGRKMCPFFGFANDVRHADRRPASQKKRYERIPGFIDKYDVPAVVTRLFLYEAICTSASVRRPVANIFSIA